MNREITFGLKMLMLIFLFTLFKSQFLFAADEKNPGAKKSQAVKEETPLPQIPDPAVAEIHKQLNDIIQLHKTLQLNTRYKVREIQKITDQAEAHRKLLAELEAARAVKRPVNPQSLEDIIRAEKIRQIQIQTVKNRQLLEEVRAQSEQIKTVGTVRMVEQARKEREEKEKKEKEKQEKKSAEGKKIQEKKPALPPVSSKSGSSKEKKPSFKLW
ncbi:MAG: hypothetical protein HYU34_00020 [Candidatus Omnitrophica bacterium]|nr:hypothetical protein [Candidatus Omnitrophota bacterium]